MASYVWPRMSATQIEEVIFTLTYQYHGGSGLNWTRADVLECPWPLAVATLDRLGKKRTAEAAAIKRAHSAPARKGGS